MLGGRDVQRIYELSGQGQSVRAIARTLGIARNSVRKYLRSPGVPTPAPRRPRPSALDPYKDYVRVRLADGLDNCVVLLRELQARGYVGGYSILKDYVRPFRQRLAVLPTRRFETAPGSRAPCSRCTCPRGPARRPPTTRAAPARPMPRKLSARSLRP